MEVSVLSRPQDAGELGIEAGLPEGGEMTPEEAAGWLRGKDGACAQCEDYSVCEENIAAADLIESQARRIAELEKDAARWMTAKQHFVCVSGPYTFTTEGAMQLHLVLAGDDPDAAIDRAMPSPSPVQKT
jgi:hypothetical protein